MGVRHRTDAGWEFYRLRSVPKLRVEGCGKICLSLHLTTNVWRDAHIRYLEAAFRSEGGKLARARVADLYLASSTLAQYAMRHEKPVVKAQLLPFLRNRVCGVLND